MLKNIFERECWLTENTQVRTIDGWINIYELKLGDILLTIKDNKLIKEPLMHLAKIRYSGTIGVYKSNDKVEIHAKRLFTPMYTFLNYQDFQLKDKRNYTGNLYHLETKSNKLIIRTFKYFHSNDRDYTTISCRVQ